MHQQDKIGAGGGSVNVDGSMSNSFRGNDQVSPFIVLPLILEKLRLCINFQFLSYQIISTIHQSVITLFNNFQSDTILSKPLLD